MRFKNVYWIFLLIAIIYLLGIGVNIMDIDAAQYASITREMLVGHDWLHIFDQGKDYLDKPPFIFWAGGISMKIFGINNFAFKLPSILFALLAVYSTFRFARLFYIRRIALLSALVLATCQALFLVTNDCRTDTILMGWVILAIWQLAQWLRYKRWWNFVVAFTAIGCGMLTKGPIALLVPAFAFGSHFLLRREYKNIFKPAYLIGIIIIVIVLIPMCIGLYQQFDMHPGKLVNNQKGVSGLRFFFWTQSFGRITGESKWNNHATVFYQLQNMLWSFLPWIFFFIGGLLDNIIMLFRQRFHIYSRQEFISAGGFILAYFAVGLSHYQLPHYIFVAFPLAAVITGKFLYEVVYAKKFLPFRKLLYPLQYLIIIAFIAAVILIGIYVFPINWLGWILIATGIIMIISLFRYRIIFPTLISQSVAVMLLVNIFLSLWFYPHLLHYQKGSEAGIWISEHHIPQGHFYIFNSDKTSHSLSFYSRLIIPKLQQPDELKQGDYVLSNKAGVDKIVAAGYQYKIAKEGEDYPVTRLKLKFLNAKTRSSTTTPYYILKITTRK